MGWRIVNVTKRAKLEFSLGYLVIRTESTLRIHLSEIDTLIIEDTSIAITAALMVELCSKKIKTVFCDEKRNPCFEIYPYYGAHDSTLKVRNQIIWNEKIKQKVWTEIVRQKITTQRNVLYKYKKPSCQHLDKFLRELKHNDSSNREGHAAKVYFNAIWGSQFSRALDNNINAGLNYGYTLFLPSVNRAIVSYGYLTQLGICHNNIFNLFNFGSDLVEPLRFIVDNKVISMELAKFSSEERTQLINLLNEKCKIDGKEHFISNAIPIYCKSIFNAIESDDISLIKFIHYEL